MKIKKVLSIPMFEKYSKKTYFSFFFLLYPEISYGQLGYDVME